MCNYLVYSRQKLLDDISLTISNILAKFSNSLSYLNEDFVSVWTLYTKETWQRNQSFTFQDISNYKWNQILIKADYYKIINYIFKIFNFIIIIITVKNIIWDASK